MPSSQKSNNFGASGEAAATPKFGRSPVLIKGVPSICPSPLPLHYRILAHLSVLVFPSLFYIGPLMLTATLPTFFFVSVRAGLGLLGLNLFLAYIPMKQWPPFRKCFQIWYEMFDFHHNIMPEKTTSDISADQLPVEDSALVIYATHPHGVIPIHGFLWCAICDQLMPGRYGVGAMTDIALRLPLLRQALSWLSATPATKRILVQRLQGRGQNLYILPGGVSEIFLACPGKHVIKTPRRGLMKLALETGALLVPCYVFGANDFYHQLATYESSTSNASSGHPINVIGKMQRKISRSFKGGFTFFWGEYGLPKPYQVKCSMVLGDSVEPVPGTLGEEQTAGGGKKTCRKVANPTEKQIDELLYRYTDALVRLFEQYKEQAGYPDATLVFE